MMELSPGVTLLLSPLNARLYFYEVMGRNFDVSDVHPSLTIDDVQRGLGHSQMEFRFCRALAVEMRRRFPGASPAHLMDILFAPPLPDEAFYILWLGVRSSSPVHGALEMAPVTTDTHSCK